MDNQFIAKCISPKTKMNKKREEKNLVINSPGHQRKKSLFSDHQ